jgi:hypothetical protein
LWKRNDSGFWISASSKCTPMQYGQLTGAKM